MSATLIAGSRTINSYELLERVIIESGFDITCVIHGGAKGVDLLGKRWAEERGILTSVYLPDWSLGKRAGPMRNSMMVNVANQAIILYDGKSLGTSDTIRKCKQKGIPYYIHTVV